MPWPLVPLYGCVPVGKCDATPLCELVVGPYIPFEPLSGDDERLVP